MSDLREAAQQALEFIRTMNQHGWVLADYEDDMARVVAALTAALAQEQAEPTGKQDLQVESVATTQQPVGDTPPSDYRRGYWAGFEIGKREGRIEAEDAAKQAEPVQEPVALLWQVRRALSWACAICDAVPNRDSGHLGVLVNAQPDGTHGYRLIHDAEAALTEYLMTPTSAPPKAEPVQEPVAWMRVIDEAMVTHHLGVAEPSDDYEAAKQKMNSLLCVAQDIGAYFAEEAEPVQEPVAWMYDCGNGGRMYAEELDDPTGWTPLYTAPPQRPPLTDEEIMALWKRHIRPISFARAVEKKVRGE